MAFGITVLLKRSLLGLSSGPAGFGATGGSVADGVPGSEGEVWALASVAVPVRKSTRTAYEAKSRNLMKACPFEGH